MAITTTQRRVQYTQAAATTEWPVNFYFQDADDLVVIKTVGNTNTTLTRGTDYAVSGAGEPEGGAVVIDPPLAHGVILTIYRDIDFTQPTQLRNQGGWFPEVHEGVFDRLTMQIQQVKEEVGRKVGLSITDTRDPDDYLRLAEAARNEAVTAKDLTEILYEAFVGKYYGAFATDPTVDPNGDTPTIGDLYFNTTTDQLRVYAAGGWESASNIETGSLAEHESPEGVEKLARLDRLVDSPFIGKGLKNYLINGNFLIWPEGTSFNTTNGTYTAEMWSVRGAIGTEGTFTVSRQDFPLGQTDVPGNPIFFARWEQTAGPSQPHRFVQNIEDVRRTAGKRLTLSFYARLNSGSFPLKIDFFQFFDDPGAGASATVTTEIADVNVLTNQWAKYSFTFDTPSITGKTLVGGGHYSAIRFMTPGSGTWSIDWAQVQLEEGSLATPYEELSYTEQYNLCHRYFYAGGARDLFLGTRAAANLSFVFIKPPVRMRTIPTIGFSSMLLRDGSGSDSSPSISAVIPQGTNYRLDIITALTPNTNAAHVLSIIDYSLNARL